LGSRIRNPALEKLLPELFPEADQNFDPNSGSLGHNDNQVTKSNNCVDAESAVPGFPGSQTIVHNQQLRSRYRRNYYISHWLASQNMYKANQTCGVCGKGLVVVNNIGSALSRQSPLTGFTYYRTNTAMIISISFCLVKKNKVHEIKYMRY
jgi:hypothetical protein